MKEVNSYLKEGERKSAIIVLKNALQNNPEDGNARLALGKIYLTLGNNSAAEKELIKAHKISPENHNISILLARTLLKNRKFKEIEALLSNTDGWPTDFIIEAYTIQAQSSIYYGDIPHAEQMLEQASQLDPNKPVVLFAKALLQATVNRPEQAEKYLKQLFLVEPNHGLGLLLQGNMAMARQEFTLAIQAFKKLTDTQSQIGLANIQLAKALIAIGKPEDAEQQLEKVLSISPKEPGANALMAKIEFGRKNYAKAALHAEASLLYSTRDLETVYIAAASYYSEKRYETAYNQINKVLDRIPNQAAALKLKAAIALKLGLTDEATSTLSKINSETFNQSDNELLVAAGLASLQDKNFDLGKRLLKQASDLNSSDPRVNLGQASIAAEEGDTDTTIAELIKAIKKSPDSQQAQIALILTYLQNQQPNQALKYAQQFTPKHPQSADGATLEGLSYIMLKDLESAETAFNKALSIEPGNPNASHNLAALIKRKSNDAKKIQTIHENVIKFHPNDATSLTELAALHQQAGEYTKAIQKLEHAVKTNPDTLRPRLLLSALYIRLNKPTQSLAISEPALEENPNSTDLLILTGSAKRLSRQPTLAIADLKKASELSPDNLTAHYQLGQLYEETNQLNLAKDAVEKVLILQPAHLGALLTKGRITLKSGDIKNANVIAQELQQVAPNNSFVIELQAQIAQADNKLDKAAELYRDVLKIRENNLNNIKLASVLWDSGNKTEALSTLTSWLQRYPEDILSMNVLANYYLLDNQFDNAITLFTNILKFTPSDATSHNNLAWLLLERNDVNTAYRHAQKANDLVPNNPQIMDTLGIVLLNKGEFRLAEQLLDDASALLPKNIDIQFHLAQANSKTGKLEKAKEILSKILSPEFNSVAFSDRKEAEALLLRINKRL
jgi:putative PEP-CTERM system TPR-repeat lipoprotein